MTQIGELVDAVYAGMAQRDHRSALRTLYKILHMTAQKRHQVQIADREMAKAILTERMWMILPMGCRFVLAPGIKLKARMRGLEPDAEGYTALDDILYQAQDRGFGCMMDDGIALNEGLIWGILLALITCPENKAERTNELNWLSIATTKTFANELWGREDFVKLVFLMDYGVKL